MSIQAFFLSGDKKIPVRGLLGLFRIRHPALP